MKIRFCMRVPLGYQVAEHRFYLDDDGQFCEAPATRSVIKTEFLTEDASGNRLGNWRPVGKMYHCIPVPQFKKRFPNASET